MAMKVCSNCGTENYHNAKSCKQCQKTRFEPAWVLAKQPVNRQVSVQVTRSNADYGDPVERVTLSKWWPGGSATFHIPNSEQWERIESIINERLAPRLGWQSAAELVDEVRERTSEGDSSLNHDDLARSLSQRPELLKRLVERIDLSGVGEGDMESVIDAFASISDALTNANAGFREAFLAVVAKLPKQKQRALEDLDLLLRGWSLQVITSVASQVKSRLDTLELFERQVQDDRTFELSGDNSIHRILERAMWMIDERYWILTSNATLRTLIGDEMSKRDAKRYGRHRPDFVCGTVGNRLIILELKRPSHTLDVDDINQLETYVAVAEEHKNFGRAEAYLVGTKRSDELARRMKYRSSAFKLLMYSDIIDNTRTRYQEFLKTVEPG